MKKNSPLRIDDRTRTAIKADGTRIPVIDATCSFLIQPSQKDIDQGIPGDHENCMYCLACRRMYDSELVWVTRTLAYIELRIKGGKSILQRFILTDPARNNVKSFDAKEELQPEAVVFAAPNGRHTLAAQAAAYKRWTSGKAKPHKKAYIVGEAGAQPDVNQPKRKVPQPGAAGLRERAYGRFQFKSKPTRHVIKGNEES
jgi:hypothetical protein